MQITFKRYAPLLLISWAALAGCSSTDSTAMAPADGGTVGNGASNASSKLASSPAPGMPAETSANGDARLEATPPPMQDMRDAQDVRQDRRNPPAAMADSGAPLQGVGARGVAQSVDLVPRSQALGVGGSVAGAAVGGMVGGRDASPNDMVYRIIVRFDDGTTRSMMQDSAAVIQGGDRVRVDSKGMLMRE